MPHIVATVNSLCGSTDQRVGHNIEMRERRIYSNSSGTMDQKQMYGRPITIVVRRVRCVCSFQLTISVNILYCRPQNYHPCWRLYSNAAERHRSRERRRCIFGFLTCCQSDLNTVRKIQHLDIFPSRASVAVLSHTGLIVGLRVILLSQAHSKAALEPRSLYDRVSLRSGCPVER